jgi:hypothetical protein
MTHDSAAEVDADQSQRRTHRIAVEVTGYGGRGPIYRVTHPGEVLLEGCRCPVFEPCRALLARGIIGRLELWRAGKASWDLAVDIEVGAGFTIIETDTQSLRLAKWVPAHPEAISRLRHRARTATNVSPVLHPFPEQTPILDAEPLTELELAK